MVCLACLPHTGPQLLNRGHRQGAALRCLCTTAQPHGCHAKARRWLKNLQSSNYAAQRVREKAALATPNPTAGTFLLGSPCPCSQYTRTRRQNNAPTSRDARLRRDFNDDLLQRVDIFDVIDERDQNP